MQPDITWTEVAVRLLLTLVAGAIIGTNRGEHRSPAGLRTNGNCARAASQALLKEIAWETQNDIGRLERVVGESDALDIANRLYRKRRQPNWSAPEILAQYSEDETTSHDQNGVISLPARRVIA